MSSVSISGAISGIDTQSLVTQLMTVEAQSQTNIKTRQTAAQSAADAYTGLITSLKSLATQSAALAKTSTWSGSAATSSNSSVTATTTGNAAGSITFDVNETAAAHTLISAADSPAASTAAVVASGGVLTVNTGGSVKGTIDVGSGTLAEVVSGINGSTLGLRAAAVQTAPGEYRLQVTSATSGSAAAFSLDGLDGFSDMNVLTAGTDAKLTIGKDEATKYTVTSATNTFSALLPGVSFTVSKKGETDVTVDAKIDGTAVAANISKMVDATNAALSSLASATSYDVSKKTGAALYGDSSIRGLQQQILSSVSSAQAPGVQLTRDGKLSFDQAAFLKAFQADPTGTAAAYGAKSSFTPNTGVLGKAAMLLPASDATRTGTYAVQVSVTAAVEKWTATPSGDLAGQTIVVNQGSLTASYTVEAGKTLTESVAAFNTRAAAAGISTTAMVDSGAIVFSANTPGVSSAFNVSMNGTVGSQVTAGRNVVGMIDGMAALGNGNNLSLNNSASRANGLRLSVNVSDDDIATSGGAIGDVTYQPGLAQRLSTLLNDVTDSSTGSLTQAQKSRASDIKDFQNQIDAWDIRLAARKATLTRQFTAMETALSKLKTSSTAITNLLANSSSSTG